MTDREKVIKGLGEILRYCHEMYSGCDNDGQYKLACMNQAAKDALALLKAQEPMQIIKVGYPDHGRCPKCGRYVSKYSNFCWYCGQAVKCE